MSDDPYGDMNDEQLANCILAEALAQWVDVRISDEQFSILTSRMADPHWRRLMLKVARNNFCVVDGAYFQKSVH
jgi:hypothetical protein